jgi:hypothetical protein
MSIKDYLLNEKVSKREIDDALKNPNVMVGAEFEFFIPEFLKDYESDIYKSELLQDKDNEELKYNDAVEQWEKNPTKFKYPVPPAWATDKSFDDEELIPPKELFPHLKIDKRKLFKIISSDKYLKQEGLPFDKKDALITYDPKVKSSKKWSIKPDGSLGLSGIEIVSPILTLKDFLNVTPKMFEYMNKLGNNVTDDACGFHISISLKNVKNLGETLDVTKLALFLDEGYIYNFFDKREFNTYAKSAFDAVRGSVIADKAPHLMKKLVDEEKLKKDYSNHHYMAINIEHLGSKNEYIEFRYLGSADYHRKWDRIKGITAHYIHSLCLACDPDYKRKEYEHKMSRILNKIQLFTVCVKMTEIHDDVENGTVDVDNELRKEWTNLWNVWKSLYFYKKSIEENEIIWDFTDRRRL